MTEEKKAKVRRKPRPKYNPNNKEKASVNNKKWKKRHKKSKKDFNESLQELQAYINGNFHVL